MELKLTVKTSELVSSPKPANLNAIQYFIVHAFLKRAFLYSANKNEQEILRRFELSLKLMGFSGTVTLKSRFYTALKNPRFLFGLRVNQEELKKPENVARVLNFYYINSKDIPSLQLDTETPGISAKQEILNLDELQPMDLTSRICNGSLPGLLWKEFLMFADTTYDQLISDKYQGNSQAEVFTFKKKTHECLYYVVYLSLLYLKEYVKTESFTWVLLIESIQKVISKMCEIMGKKEDTPKFQKPVEGENSFIRALQKYLKKNTNSGEILIRDSKLLKDESDLIPINLVKIYSGAIAEQTDLGFPADESEASARSYKISWSKQELRGFSRWNETLVNAKPNYFGDLPNIGARGMAFMFCLLYHDNPLITDMLSQGTETEHQPKKQRTSTGSTEKISGFAKIWAEKWNFHDDQTIIIRNFSSFALMELSVAEPPIQQQPPQEPPPQQQQQQQPPVQAPPLAQVPVQPPAQIQPPVQVEPPVQVQVPQPVGLSDLNPPVPAPNPQPQVPASNDMIANGDPNLVQRAKLQFNQTEYDKLQDNSKQIVSTWLQNVENIVKELKSSSFIPEHHEDFVVQFERNYNVQQAPFGFSELYTLTNFFPIAFTRYFVQLMKAQREKVEEWPNENSAKKKFLYHLTSNSYYLMYPFVIGYVSNKPIKCPLFILLLLYLPIDSGEDFIKQNWLLKNFFNRNPHTSLPSVEDTELKLVLTMLKSSKILSETTPEKDIWTFQNRFTKDFAELCKVK